MEASFLLKRVGINPDEPVLLITAGEALENLLEAVNEYYPDLKIDKMKKEDIIALLDSYKDCVVLYHPEAYHQERGALLKNFEMLKRYGLTDDDYDSLDFY
ncbi:MAG: hypothetical protein HXY53_05325 [Nitrospirae bacterium]|nr:hypothetical protein [Nitrospirota bacterium]